MDFSDSFKDLRYPNRFNLSPSMKALLKRNITTFTVGLRKHSEYGRNLSSGSISRFEGGVKKIDKYEIMQNQNVISSSLSKFHHLNFNENSKQIEDFERQVNKRKYWAYQKVMQVAYKLRTSMKTLINLGKRMKIVVQETSNLVDSGNLIKKKIENENDEIRAEIEAYKLRASEYETTRLEALKQEKKCRKKLKVWEKQKKKLQDNIAAEKQVLLDLQQQLVEGERTKKEVEAKWKQEQRATGQALSLLKEETFLNKEAKATNKIMLMDMRLSFEIESQQYKDELQRLHQELSRLKASNEVPERDAAKMLHDIDRLEVCFSNKDESSVRKCVICKKGEVSVVFLPCAHQVICANCNDNYGNNGRAICPSCRVPIERRIWVFGATS
ncbi:hypothetical protein R3W88_021334 [Solanum pinnatisectum]|uniref:RING-type domain-containing protein n=1 Tax=Solanum pinnatisectum TaxID=50273 RepID=A0AAV9LRK1_9SOLN|nr:hypothetical protein R3W88_021334 [Solanum pinnatisectum]